MADWEHDALAADLATHLDGSDRMIWLDMQLGPSGSPRPDVFVLNKSYSRPMPTAYEVKVSRSDLRSDITSGKWQSYLKFAGAVVFAVPEGLCSPSEIPDGCGLIARKKEVWRNVRKPVLSATEPPFSACMKLLIDGVGRVYSKPTPAPRRLETWVQNKSVLKKFGLEVERCARDLVACQQRLDDIRAVEQSRYSQMQKEVAAAKEAMLSQVEAECATWKGIKTEVTQWLDLPDTASRFAVTQALNAKKRAADSDERVVEAEDRLSRARATLKNLLSQFPDNRNNGSSPCAR